MTVTESVSINAPASIIFEYLMDIDNRSAYIPALEEVIMLDPLPIRKGSRYTEVANIAGRRLSTTYQVTAYIKDRKLTAKTLKSIFPIEVDLSLEESSEMSHLKISLEFKLTGIFKIGGSIVKGIVSQQARDILSRIKTNVEYKVE